jgi:epsilon-lactone hydrolase
MGIVDRNKARPDVLAFLDKFNKDFVRCTRGYLLKKFYMLPKILALTRKMARLNDYTYRERITESVKLREMIPTLKDVESLLRINRAMTEIHANWYQRSAPYSPDLTFKKVEIGNVHAEWQIPKIAHEGRVILYFHGGGFTLDSVNKLRIFSAEAGLRLGMKVLSVDYRLAPEHPFPAGLDDCYAVYRWLLDQGIQAKNIVLMGESAGGNLVLSTIARAKQEKLPLPAGGVCFSPLTDLSLSDTRFFQNGPTDLVLGDMLGYTIGFLGYYAGESDLKNPLVSPFYADVTGFPPLLIQSSKSELVYFDNQDFVEKARAAKVPVTFHAWEGMIHCFPCYMRLKPGWPEIDEALAELEAFIKSIF